jgi:phosphoglycerate kinase
MIQLKNIDVKNKRVLVRCDFDVPLDNGKILNDFRIRKAIPTIKYLIDKGAKVTLMGHLGRPNGAEESLRMAPVKKRVVELLGQEITVLENLRFNKGEEENSDEFAKELASLADIYVNDAFAVSHRNHASVTGITKYLPSFAGLLLESEVKILSEAMNSSKLVAVIGGSKVETKIKVIQEFLEKADHVLIGGKIANAILAVKGMAPKSYLPKDIEEVKKINLTSTKLHLPVDVMATGGRESALAKVKEDEEMLDIGPETIKMFSKIIKTAKNIVWAGPLGYFEDPVYAKGTKEIGLAIVNSKAFKIAGGGDTISALSEFNLMDKFDHISTGGGAMLMFLGGEELPGLKVLE